jgi:uncharacterized protein
MQHWELFFFFLVIAFIYASVGFGGGSSYLAILALYALPVPEMKLTALLCNILVVTGGTLIYIRHGQVAWKKIIPLIAVSVPVAFLGARLRLKQDTFFILLGCSLLAASVLLWLRTKGLKRNTESAKKENYLRDAVLGAGIGFLSGMVGIGGGIFLSPVLNLIDWDTPKKIAATASLFILVNSLSGIAGQLSSLPAEINYSRIALLCVAVLAGGQAGARIGAIKLDQLVIRRLTALLVFAAGTEVLLKHLPW